MEHLQASLDGLSAVTIRGNITIAIRSSHVYFGSRLRAVPRIIVPVGSSSLGHGRVKLVARWTGVSGQRGQHTRIPRKRIKEILRLGRHLQYMCQISDPVRLPRHCEAGRN